MDNKVVVAVLFVMLVSAGILGYVNGQNQTNLSKPTTTEQNILPGQGTKNSNSGYTTEIESNNSKDSDNEKKVHGCIVTGCSNQICAPDERITTCEYKDEYACYADAVCEIQQNGDCGWTLTDKARECLQDIAIFGNESI